MPQRANLERASRNALTDIARFVGALGILWFHAAAPGSKVALAALPMFMMMLVFFSLRAAEERSMREVAVDRAQRLLSPWVAWSMAFGALKLFDALADGRPIASEFHPYMLLTGPALHLWFLPFAFACSLLAVAVARWCGGSRGAFVALAASFAPLTVLLTVASRESEGIYPLAQWLSVAPAAFLGVLAHLAGAAVRERLMLAAVCLVAVVALAAAGLPGDGARLGIAALVVMACVGVELRSTAVSRALGAMSLGVYLVHPIFISIFLRLKAPPAASVELALAVALCSIALVIFLRQLPGARWFA